MAREFLDFLSGANVASDIGGLFSKLLLKFSKSVTAYSYTKMIPFGEYPYFPISTFAGSPPT